MAYTVDEIERRLQSAGDELVIGNPRVDIADLQGRNQALEFHCIEPRSVDAKMKPAPCLRTDPVEGRAQINQLLLDLVSQQLKSPLLLVLKDAFIFRRLALAFGELTVEFGSLLAPFSHHAVELEATQLDLRAGIADDRPVSQGDETHGSHGIDPIENASDLATMRLTLAQDEIADGSFAGLSGLASRTGAPLHRLTQSLFDERFRQVPCRNVRFGTVRLLLPNRRRVRN